MLDVIAFDADDTLWHTERYYRQVEKSFLQIMAGYGASSEEALAVLHRIEIDNLAFFGYGIRGFTLSLIETAVQVTGGRVRASDIQAIVDLGRGMTGHEIELLDGVEETLRALSGRRLMLLTKGDTLDQAGKLRRSGLADYFPSVEIVLDKTSEVYGELLERHRLDPSRFLMVGNSLRSDIAPVVALGGYAVYVPYPDGWAHESAADLPEDRARFFEIDTLRKLPGLIAQIEQGK
jgi:putative hydrolase of the HAD superfamily